MSLISARESAAPRMWSPLIRQSQVDTSKTWGVEPISAPHLGAPQWIIIPGRGAIAIRVGFHRAVESTLASRSRSQRSRGSADSGSISDSGNAK